MKLSNLMRLLPLVIAPILLAGCIIGDPLAESTFIVENATNETVRVKTILRKACRSSLELEHEEREFTVAAGATQEIHATRTVVEPILPGGCFDALEVFDQNNKLRYTQQPADDAQWRQEPPQPDALTVSFTFTLRPEHLQSR